MIRWCLVNEQKCPVDGLFYHIRQAEKKKLSHYEQLATSGYKVMAVAVETLCSWAPLAAKFVKETGCRITDATGEKHAASFLFQALGIAIQRGNSASISGTVPSMKRLDEVYYLLLIHDYLIDFSVYF